MKNFAGLVILVSILSMQLCLAEMDWENLIIRTSDTDPSKLPGLLTNELYSLPYEENSTVRDFLRSHPDREITLVNLLNEHRTGDQHYLTDGTIEYIDNLSLTNKIMNILLPETKPVNYVVPMLCPSCNQEWPHGMPLPEGVALRPKQIEADDYTGIIIDCRSLKIIPCLFPKIYNEKLEEVYSVDFADPRYVAEGGLVLYTTKDLLNNPRIGPRPLHIQAIGVVSNKRTNLKISALDGRRVHGSIKNLQLIKECRVVIIYTP